MVVPSRNRQCSKFTVDFDAMHLRIQRFSYCSMSYLPLLQSAKSMFVQIFQYFIVFDNRAIFPFFAMKCICAIAQFACMKRRIECPVAFLFYVICCADV